MYTVDNKLVPTLFEILDSQKNVIAGCTVNMRGHLHMKKSSSQSAADMAELICKLLNENEAKQ